MPTHQPKRRSLTMKLATDPCRRYLAALSWLAWGVRNDVHGFVGQGNRRAHSFDSRASSRRKSTCGSYLHHSKSVGPYPESIQQLVRTPRDALVVPTASRLRKPRQRHNIISSTRLQALSSGLTMPILRKPRPLRALLSVSVHGLLM